MLEKESLYGGTTARSGGVLWVPCHGLGDGLGGADRRRRRAATCRASAARTSMPEKVDAFLQNGRRMVDFFTSRTSVQFVNLAAVPGLPPQPAWRQHRRPLHPGSALRCTAARRPHEGLAAAPEGNHLHGDDVQRQRGSAALLQGHAFAALGALCHAAARRPRGGDAHARPRHPPHQWQRACSAAGQERLRPRRGHLARRAGPAAGNQRWAGQRRRRQARRRAGAHRCPARRRAGRRRLSAGRRAATAAVPARAHRKRASLARAAGQHRRRPASRGVARGSPRRETCRMRQRGSRSRWCRAATGPPASSRI